MKMNSKRIVVALLALSLLSLSGCNTWKGLGRDVESLGESMQGVAK